MNLLTTHLSREGLYVLSDMFMRRNAQKTAKNILCAKIQMELNMRSVRIETKPMKDLGPHYECKV